ncbi:MAG: serine/threonine protein kinase [Deltaproteobacteria bacterium]|nr:serine/threonine protein kinase [Deltaproteobacteria bacterium]
MKDLVGKALEGKYQIIRIIGEGGMGVVFEARHLLLERKLAVKVLHADVATDAGVVQRFHNEARVTAALGHPNIIEVTDMGILPSGAPFLVMEYLEGESLAHRIEQGGPLPVAEAVEVVVQVLDALSVVHEAGVVHRDLKPDNVFLATRAGAAGRGKSAVKLLDFGISKLRERDGRALNLTRTGTTLGTPYYMAPEQAAGKKQVDHRLDLYAVGVILYESLTGKRPFDGDTYNAILAAILTEPVVPPILHRKDLGQKLDRIIVRALSRNPQERFSSAEEFLRALEPFAPASVSSRLSRSQTGPGLTKSAVGTPAARSGPGGEEAVAGGRRRGRLLAAAVGLVLAGIAAVVVAVVGRGGGERGGAPDDAAVAVGAGPGVVDRGAGVPDGGEAAVKATDGSPAAERGGPASSGGSVSTDGESAAADAGAAAVPAPQEGVKAGEGDAAGTAGGNPSRDAGRETGSAGEAGPAVAPPAAGRSDAAARDAGGQVGGDAGATERGPEAAVVTAALERLRGGVRTCLGGRAGAVVCRVTLDGATGGVRDVVASAGLEPQVDQCVEGVLRGLRVAPFGGATYDATHTFRFRPEAPPATRDAGAPTPSIDHEFPQ